MSILRWNILKIAPFNNEMTSIYTQCNNKSHNYSICHILNDNDAIIYKKK